MGRVPIFSFTLPPHAKANQNLARLNCEVGNSIKVFHVQAKDSPCELGAAQLASAESKVET